MELDKQRTYLAGKLLEAVRSKRGPGAGSGAPRRAVGASPATNGAAAIPSRIRWFRIISPNKVGILSDAYVKADLKSYFDPGQVFAVRRLQEEAHSRRIFLQLEDGMGWVPECSRKDAARKIVMEVGAVRKAIEDEKGSDSSDSDPEPPTSRPEAAADTSKVAPAAKALMPAASTRAAPKPQPKAKGKAKGAAANTSARSSSSSSSSSS